jgi:hypothetical protein
LRRPHHFPFFPFVAGTPCPARPVGGAAHGPTGGLRMSLSARTRFAAADWPVAVSQIFFPFLAVSAGVFAADIILVPAVASRRVTSAGANIPNQMFRHPTWRSFLPSATVATAATGSPTTTHNEQEPHLLGHTTLDSLYLLHSQIIKTLQTSYRNGGDRPRPQNNIPPALSHSISIPHTFQNRKATPP